MRHQTATRYSVLDGVQTFAEPTTVLGSFVLLVVGELHARETKPHREWFAWGHRPHADAGKVEAVGG